MVLNLSAIQNAIFKIIIISNIFEELCMVKISLYIAIASSLACTVSTSC